MGHLQQTGAVREDELEAPNGSEAELFISGTVVLRDGKLKLGVTKKLEIVDGGIPKDPLVQTIEYTYHVWIVNRTNVFRYCSPHKDSGPESPDFHHHHHRHGYEPFGVNPERYTVSTLNDWPTLGEVIEEADRWYWENHLRL